MSFYILVVALALGSVLIANYTDLRERIIPNKLTYSMIVVGIAIHLIYGIINLDFTVAIRGFIGAGLAFGIGYGMYLIGGWAGGDVKLFAGLGALLPVYTPFLELPYPVAFPPYAAVYPLFPITLLLNSLIVAFPVFLVYGLISKVRNKGFFYETVEISNLEEGKIPAEIIYEKEGEIGRYETGILGFISRKIGAPDWDKKFTDPNKAAGVTQEQVQKLKELVSEGILDDFIKVKKGTPFAPAFAAGLMVSVFYGGIYWRIIISLI